MLLRNDLVRCEAAPQVALSERARPESGACFGAALRGRPTSLCGGGTYTLVHWGSRPQWRGRRTDLT
eukprot:9841802-Alexandrium_andersonii.AAC.1